MNHLIYFLTKVWWVIPIIIFAWYLKTPRGKGMFGEFMLNLVIKIKLDSKVYHLIKNVTIPTEDGSTQLDHIIVSKYAIFVIETKNYQGWITGSATKITWTQTIYRNKYQFQNPIHQNYKHTRTLETLLELPENTIKSLIVFVGECELKSKFPSNVTSGRAWYAYIKSFEEVIYTDEQVKQFIESIRSARLSRSIKTHINHVKHVKSIVNEKEKSSSLSSNQVNRNQTVTVPQSQGIQGVCGSCQSPEITIRNMYGYKVTCLSCKQVAAFELPCPDCSNLLKLKKLKSDYTLKCSGCSFSANYVIKEAHDVSTS